MELIPFRRDILHHRYLANIDDIDKWKWKLACNGKYVGSEKVNRKINSWNMFLHKPVAREAFGVWISCVALHKTEQSTYLS